MSHQIWFAGPAALRDLARWVLCASGIFAFPQLVSLAIVLSQLSLFSLLLRALGELWALDPVLEVGDELVVLSFADLLLPDAQSLDLHALLLFQHLVD